MTGLGCALNVVSAPARQLTSLVGLRTPGRPPARCTHVAGSVNSPEKVSTAIAESPTATVPEVDPRRFLSILPPFFSRETKLEEFGNGLWGLVQPLKPPGQADIRLRMVAARLDDGNLLLCGPLAPTGELLDMLRHLGGEVTHIVVPNTSPEHWLFGPAMADAFQSATMWFVPGFFEGKGVPLPGRSLLFRNARARGQCRTLGHDPLPEELQGQVHTVLFDVPFFLEAAVSLPRHSALLLADTAVCLSASDPEYSGIGERNEKVARQLGVWDRLGPVTRVVFQQYPQQGKAWVEAVLDECPEFDVVLPAHGSAPITTEARQAFKNCFDFLY